MTEYAGYLPGVDPDTVHWEMLSFNRGNSPLTVAVPRLAPDDMAALVARVRAARDRELSQRSVAEIIRVIDTAIARLLDRNDPYRQRAERLLPVVTGYDAEMVRLGLTQYLKTFRRAELTRFVSEDFANPGCLDGFQPAAKGGYTAAHGPGILAHVWAGNVPALPLWSFVCGLLVKAGNVGKLASAEPLFASWFAQLLAEVEPTLAECFAIVWWRGGDEEAEAALFQRSDVVLAYGGNDSLAAMGKRVPITTRYLPYGHKISFGMVGREALSVQKAPQTAHLAGYDIMHYDQQGCYSPQLIFVEQGGRISPPEFAQYVAHELASFEHKFPRRTLTLDEARDVASWRQRQEMNALTASNQEIFTDPKGAWTVTYRPATADEPVMPSGLNRTVQLIGVNTLDDVADAVRPLRKYLQTAGIATSPERVHTLSGSLASVGVTRLCALGAMTAPEAGWHHDGRFNLLDLITVSEIENSATQLAEQYASYVD